MLKYHRTKGGTALNAKGGLLGDGNIEHIARDAERIIGRVVGAHSGNPFESNLFLLIAGPPCKDLSRANKARTGVLGEKSRLVFAVVDILSELQRQAGPCNTAFVIENVASMKDADRDIFSHFFGGVAPVKLKGLEFRPMVRQRYYWPVTFLPSSFLW